MKLSPQACFLVSLFSLLILLKKDVYAACSDDFSGTTLGPQWTFVDFDNNPTSGSVAVNGKLELTGRGYDIFKDVNQYVGIQRTDITGDFDVSVKIESLIKSFIYAQAGILVANDISHLEKGGYVMVNVTPENGENFFYDAEQPIGGLDKYISVTKNGFPVWLRLAKKEGRFSAWYKNKLDENWTSIADGITTLGTTAPSQIVLFAFSHSITLDTKAVFDDFTCLHAPVTGIWKGIPLKRSNKDKDNLGMDAKGRQIPLKAIFQKKGF